ncbi:hypothetical protein KSP35_09345 [Aquihabitans sp. G128]|nr:hypothetical protein [Aquihabitans sp. G128]QXC62963.1 hypothetical protein KSP35_09345 [Aquihabitans sp. G128]
MDDLARQAIEVLWRNARGTWTRPSPRLYPHQWSWDAGFVAMGWAQLDPLRGVTELWSLFRGQWSTGMVPQIVFDLNVARGAYEPGPNTWGTVRHAPAGSATSGICQPPIHAIALGRVREAAVERDDGTLAEVDDAIVDLYPRLVAWHRWLRTARDPDHTGLVTILHPWESGLDNSPRWDQPLESVDPGDDGSDLPRPDLTYVADPDERPSDDEYRKYRHLVDCLIAVDYDQGRALAHHPFRVADVWFSAILAAADDVLADLAEVAGRPERADGHRADAEHTRAALDGCWDAEHGRCLDIDRITGKSIPTDTIAGFAPPGGRHVHRPHGDPGRAAVVAVVRRVPRPALGPAPEHGGRRPVVRGQGLLAGPAVAADDVAAVVVAGACRPRPQRRPAPGRGGRPAAHHRLHRVRRRHLRRGARLRRPVLDRRSGARLAGPRGLTPAGGPGWWPLVGVRRWARPDPGWR